MLQLKTWSMRGASNHLAFKGKWMTVISLILLEDEWSFKGMRMCGHSEISSCWICDWCESREMEGKGSPRLLTPLVESFSTDLLPAIKSYWTESPFILCILPWEKDTKLLHIMPLLLEWGENNTFLWVCIAETVLLLLSILFCILLWWWCVKITKWTGAINVNTRFQTLCIILSLLSCFVMQCYRSTSK